MKESDTAVIPGPDARRRRYKRPLDLAILVLAHLLLLPLWLVLWAVIPLLIWLEDRGPVFYVQERVGWNGRTFSLFKFRSMRVPRGDGPWAEHTEPGDARITRIGRLLRRTALDELPQTINLWKGDISLVGPRALPVPMHERDLAQEPNFAQRLQVRPGLTGIAQVSLPRHCEPTTRLECDLLYIRTQGLLLDLKLILTSVLLTLAGRWGAGRRKIEDDATQRAEA